MLPRPTSGRNRNASPPASRSLRHASVEESGNPAHFDEIVRSALAEVLPNMHGENALTQLAEPTAPLQEAVAGVERAAHCLEAIAEKLCAGSLFSITERNCISLFGAGEQQGGVQQSAVPCEAIPLSLPQPPSFDFEALALRLEAAAARLETVDTRGGNANDTNLPIEKAHSQVGLARQCDDAEQMSPAPFAKEVAVVDGDLGYNKFLTTAEDDEIPDSSSARTLPAISGTPSTATKSHKLANLLDRIRPSDQNRRHVFVDGEIAAFRESAGTDFEVTPSAQSKRVIPPLPIAAVFAASSGTILFACLHFDKTAQRSMWIASFCAACVLQSVATVRAEGSTVALAIEAAYEEDLRRRRCLLCMTRLARLSTWVFAFLACGSALGVVLESLIGLTNVKPIYDICVMLGYAPAFFMMVQPLLRAHALLQMPFLDVAQQVEVQHNPWDQLQVQLGQAHLYGCRLLRLGQAGLSYVSAAILALNGIVRGVVFIVLPSDDDDEWAAPENVVGHVLGLVLGVVVLLALAISLSSATSLVSGEVGETPSVIHRARQRFRASAHMMSRNEQIAYHNFCTFVRSASLGPQILAVHITPKLITVLTIKIMLIVPPALSAFRNMQRIKA